MRIASYNVMSGGFDEYEYETPTPQRLADLQAAVSELEAEVIGLVDTFRWDEIYSPSDLKEIFGYEYAVCINLNDQRLRDTGHNNGLTLLSNIEILDSGPITIGTRDALHARLKIDGQVVSLYLTYLDDLSEDVRLAQIEALVGDIDLTLPVIIMGDLNSLKTSDLGSVDTNLKNFYTSNPAMKEKLEPLLQGMQRGEVIKYLNNLGLKDAANSYQPTFPTQLFPAKVAAAFLRLDYCFYSQPLSVSNFVVPNGAIFQRSSDHLPIVFEASVSKKS